MCRNHFKIFERNKKLTANSFVLIIYNRAVFSATKDKLEPTEPVKWFGGVFLLGYSILIFLFDMFLFALKLKV